MKFIVVIPARFKSARLPGKPLIEISGKPMIEWVWQSAISSQASQVIIATDDKRIMKTCQGFGAETHMTDTSHNSGTDRIAEIVDILGLENDELIVNLQGDEPLMPTTVINQVAFNLQSKTSADLSTLCEPILKDSEFHDPNVVKVLIDSNGFAISFSRAPIPYSSENLDENITSANRFRHIGIYAYRAGFVRTFSQWNPVPLEESEKLEQLRAIYYGVKIDVAVACEKVPAGVDTESDLVAIRAVLR